MQHSKQSPHQSQNTNEGKDISTKMIEGFELLDKNIESTNTLIDNVTDGVNEQLSGMNQINSAINQLDRDTQNNANMANKTNQIAIDTQSISQTIFSNANEKKFRRL